MSPDSPDWRSLRPAASTAAVVASDSLRARGNDHNGHLGDGGTTSRDTLVAVKLPAGTTVTLVLAGGKDGLAVTAAGHVLAWGDNECGQLGDGTTKAVTSGQGETARTPARDNAGARGRPVRAAGRQPP
jgi:alpha-tubulin suppressor-like RCC1 family protein